MSELIKIQYVTQTNIDKMYKNFKKSPKDRLSKLSYINTRLETLEERWKCFLGNHTKIAQELSDDDDDYFKEEVFEKTEEVYIDYKSELKEIIENLTEDVVKHCKTHTENSNVKLPKITIPTFSGNYTEWTTFRDLYISLVHKNTSLDNVQKMHYLKGHLSGEAEQLLRHVSITADNYTESWSLLNSRYNNKKYLANSLLKRFMNQPSIGNESCSSIKEMLDNLNETLNGLKNLGVDIVSWDVIIIYILSAKLDSESRKQWETKISTSDELPALSKFKEFLEARFRSLEFLDAKTKSKPSFSNNKPKVLHAISNNNIELQSCPFCKKSDHRLFNCKQFSKIDSNERRNFVQTNRLCFNCLGRNHSSNFCRNTTKCRICKHRHHSLLHPKPNSDQNNGQPETEAKIDSPTKDKESTVSDENDVKAHFSKEMVSSQILLATALVEVKARNGHVQVLRALIDQGSQASFITEAAVQLLGLSKVSTRSTISGLGGDTTTLASKHIVSMTLQSRHDVTFSVKVRAHVLRAITSMLPTKRILNHDWPELNSITLADPKFHTPNKIDILLGADVYGQIIRDGLINDSKGLPIAQNTALGWILSGPTPLNHDHSDVQCHHNIIVSMHAHADDNDLLKRFWQIESDSFDTKILSQEEQLCEQHYDQTTKRNADGRYIVRLPFREEDPQCKYGNSRDIAIKRFHLLENRFKKNPEIKTRYSEVIHEYLDLGHMHRVPANEVNSNEAVYLPHHAVIREDKSTTKVRVVFDASSKGTNGISLNDTLMVGPTLQPDLRHIIMRWRIHPICLSADIIKMYRQIMIAEQDVDFQRLVWRDDPEAEIEEYRLVRVTFGTAAAPYLAVKSLQQIAFDEGDRHPLVSEKVKTDYYVDDLMTGCQSVEEGKAIYKEMKDLLGKGGFELQKWITNNKELAKEIMDGGKGKEGNVDIKIDETVKILGLTWDPQTDSFYYSVNLPVQQEPITKRKVVSDISRLFDPLGWIAPCVIVAKVMIQKLWLAGIDWDDELPEGLLHEWLTYRNELLELRKFEVSRWISTRDDDVSLELHGFCDASIMAYAAVVYLRNIDVQGNIHVNLIAAKTKVAPTMQVSIPRLELMGAVLLSKLIVEVAKVLKINENNIHAWTDSTVVLAWLSCHPSRWTTFIGNRTSQILSQMNNNQWAHVQSTHNPADVASRGLKPSELSYNDLWIQGPSWLREPQIHYTRPKSLSTDLEQKKIKSHVGLNNNTDDEDHLWTKFSSLQRLVRVVAFCRRFLKIKENKSLDVKFEPYLTSAEIAESMDVCIRQCQKRAFKDLKQLKSLCPIVDDKGIMRVGGRIQNAELPECTKHPIILPHKSHFTYLVIDEAHKRTLHGGPTLMLNHLRTKYWIISAKGLVKAFVRKCVICVRQAAVSKTQLMGQLPSCRVKPAKPFLHSGVDFAGPINVRVSKGRGNKSYKGYISLFVCMVTKAIHLEMVSDLTTEGFIAAFKRFVGRRGHVSDIWSDNGTNFIGASKELRKLYSAEQSSVGAEIRGWLSNNSVTWHFIPPHSPNFGGLWEAGVKSTKFHLKRVIGESTLTFEEMTTVLIQVEACLNSRPLSILPNNAGEPLPLTPGHFLVGEPLVTVAERNYEQSNVSSLRRWQMTQKMVQDFWRRWSNEYLVHCLQRYKWSKVEAEPSIGDVVLVKEENLPPSRWLLGRVEQKHPGLDNFTRVVTLKCNGSLIKRPTSKLCVLPISD